MRIRSLILTLLLAAPFAAAGNLECNRETPRRSKTMNEYPVKMQ